jgi:hypothetical protein
MDHLSEQVRAALAALPVRVIAGRVEVKVVS